MHEIAQSFRLTFALKTFTSFRTQVQAPSGDNDIAEDSLPLKKHDAFGTHSTRIQKSLLPFRNSIFAQHALAVDVSS